MQDHRGHGKSSTAVLPSVLGDFWAQSLKTLVHPKLCEINLHNVTHSLVYRNLRERMFVVHISLLLSHFSFLYHKNCH